MIREASIFDLKKMNEEDQRAYGLRVLTMRRWPRGISRGLVSIWLPSAGPSVDLLSLHRQGLISWDEFLAAYTQEQAQQELCSVTTYDSIKPSKITLHCSPITYLARLAASQTVTLLCWEKTECHRFMLKELVEQEIRR